MAFLINIKFNSDDNIPIEVQPHWTTKDIKDAISAKRSIPAEQIRIIFQGKELQNSFSLQDCDIGNHSVLHVVQGRKVKSTVSSVAAEHDERLRSQQDSNRRQFFVYCKSHCNDIQPGKLRVRCAVCKTGSITLTTEPGNWDDVLQAGRIPGECQSENCNGNRAEFYFKCAGHEQTSTQDTSVALYLVKNNSHKVECVTCADVSNRVLVFPCEDGHSICLDCFKEYCTTLLTARRFVEDPEHGYTIGCPAGCANSFIKEIHHFRVLGNELYERYQRFAAEEYLLRFGGGIMCPAPGCGAGLVLTEGQRRIMCEIQRTQGCGFIFCRECREAYHEGPCHLQTSTAFQVNARNAERARWEAATTDTIHRTTKRCPQCRVPVEKDGGCMHMVCTRCQFSWCWMCEQQWSRSCEGDHWFG